MREKPHLKERSYRSCVGEGRSVWVWEVDKGLHKHANRRQHADASVLQLRHASPVERCLKSINQGARGGVTQFCGFGDAKRRSCRSLRLLGTSWRERESKHGCLQTRRRGWGIATTKQSKYYMSSRWPASLSTAAAAAVRVAEANPLLLRC